ncbi:arginine--tRNA ligase [Ostreibacterium oceani]|uniref:Arginine--tRNA ligase n=1 Tax=Ostreibacterium oceani TaxID=2654998 RepID=A0A6N7EYI0_9GAMM|nr:arginine--tRNA ligase [Ostreibacterium oceani]MPV86439.1 arginine--tRNA ligase [Ostreibacterium oceani]
MQSNTHSDTHSDIQANLEAFVQSAINTLVVDGKLEAQAKDSAVQIERAKDATHGDFACNIAMQLAGKLRLKPRDIATLLVDNMQQAQSAQAPWLDSVTIAGPGFINFTLSLARYNTLIQQVLATGQQFGTVMSNAHSQKILLEFVSANPTGPLHVGHGRGAAYGATLANILRAAGHRVDKEYYVNDAGRQMDILATSVYLRYLQRCDIAVDFPINAYQASYVNHIADGVYTKYGKDLVVDIAFNQLPISDYTAFVDEQQTTKYSLAACEARLTADDKAQIPVLKSTLDALKQQSEQHLDALIHCLKTQLGEKNYGHFFDAALTAIRDDIEADLREFGVTFDHWYSEKTLHASGKIEKAINQLQANGHLYEQNGALWFASSAFGDDKDRVIQRENGLYTYFAADIAYHHEKMQRNYDLAIDILGADHHGYTARVRAALLALGHDADRLRVDLVQFAVLYKDGKKMQMSTRSGQYVTLRDLRDLIGSAAARYFYVIRKPQQHMDFDLDLAVKNNKDNPLYYVQYAHARICRVLDKARPEQPNLSIKTATKQIDQLTNEYEQNLLRELEKYASVLGLAAKDFAPHYLTNYLKDLATALHSYYDAGNIKFLQADPLQASRLALLDATRQVLSNGLQLCGVDAPEVM